jgi:hypothetical protein
MRTQMPEECECIGVFEVTVNFVQRRLLGGCTATVLRGDLLAVSIENKEFRTSRLLVCAVFFFLMAQQSPLWATRFFDHTERRTTGGRTPLDE